MTAEFYNKNEIAKAHLARATVAIPQKNDQKQIIGYKPYISKEGRYDVAVDMWNPPPSETHEMRIVPSYEIREVKSLLIIVADAVIQFRPRNSTDEAHWSTYFREYGSAFIEKTNRDGGTYLVDDAIEKAVTGAIVRVYGLAGIGTSANPEDMPKQGNQQRSAPAQQQAPQQKPTQQQQPAKKAEAPFDPWPAEFSKLNEKQQQGVINYILKEVEISAEDLDALIDDTLKRNAKSTALDILNAASA